MCSKKKIKRRSSLIRLFSFNSLRRRPGAIWHTPRYAAISDLTQVRIVAYIQYICIVLWYEYALDILAGIK